LLQRKNIYILEVDRQCPYGTNFLEDYVAEGADLQAEVIDGHYMSCLVNHAGGKDLYVILF